MKITYYIIFLSLMIQFTYSNIDHLKLLKFETRKELNKYVKDISKDLGVKCSYCHDLNDKSIDTDLKLIALEMIQMQQNINQTYFNILNDSLTLAQKFEPISCWTCHRGKNIPEFIRSTK